MFDLSQYETKLDPDRHSHLGIIRGEESVENYSDFFSWNLVDWPPYIQSALDKGMRKSDVAMDVGGLTGLLKPGYLPMETGYARCATGELSVAVLTPLPGVSAEMIDWWMGWHSCSTERYKLWHPQAHLFSQPRFSLASVPGLSSRDRYVGNTSWVDEYVGPVMAPLAITFLDPSDLGISYSALASSGHGTAVVAKVENSSTGEHLAYLCHAIRETQYGTEMRSRFVFRPETPDAFGSYMLDHCATEMNHLGSFLPRLYAKVIMNGEDRENSLRG